ncbi:hypothetical protein [Kitasatospora sp. NPDC057541]|uniref:hypothetical protein n=1 Tax=unclassified Kitasatospora TaxID=2633591 RepID=UPI0036B43EBD
MTSDFESAGGATVSGRSYVRTRPRGFAPWRPRPETLRLVEQVQGVLDQYREHLPMTARQVFYAAVGQWGYPKTEQAYDRLLETLVRARRARMIPMHAIRDDSSTDAPAGGWADKGRFLSSLRRHAEYYERDLMEGQDRVAEVWVESGGMVPMLAAVAHRFGAGVYSGGGFGSVTLKYDTATRIAYRERGTTVLSIGDFDPSGLSILDAAAEDVSAFVAELGGPAPRYVRVAVTPEQIAEHRLPTAPQKTRDRRGAHMEDTVQAEALTPDQLTGALSAALERVLDLDRLRRVREAGDRERAEIIEHLDRLGLDS